MRAGSLSHSCQAGGRGDTSRSVDLLLFFGIKAFSAQSHPQEARVSVTLS